MSIRSLVMFFAVLLFVAAGAACGDGDGLVRIRHLEFDASEHVLRVFGDVVPPVAHSYPDLVAKVNGEDVTGDDLMARQVQLVEDRRALERIVSRADDEFAPLFEQFDRADPLELIIEEALLRQAVLREGTLADRAEVEEWLRENEAYIYGTERTPEEVAELQDMLVTYGYPLRNWTADDRIVENLRMRRGIGTLGDLFCDGVPESPFDRDWTSSTGYDCSAFLAAERAAADIVYFVRWAD